MTRSAPTEGALKPRSRRRSGDLPYLEQYIYICNLSLIISKQKYNRTAFHGRLPRRNGSRRLAAHCHTPGDVQSRSVVISCMDTLNDVMFSEMRSVVAN